MSAPLSIRCANCGTSLETSAPGVTSVRCPVCQLQNDIGSTPQQPAFTRDSLEHSLGDLIAQARAGGVASEEILTVLRDELEFAAELALAGRQVCVQIVDLGPREGQATTQPVRDRAAALRSRAVGG